MKRFFRFLSAPLLLLGLRTHTRRPLWIWLACWEGGIALAMAVGVRAAIIWPERWTYQALLGLNPDPLRASWRILRQYGYHLIPLLGTAPSDLLVVAVPLAVAVYGSFFALLSRRLGSHADPRELRRFLVKAGAAGLLAAALGYSLFTLGAGIGGPGRMEFFSGPGMALFLASAVSLSSTWFPKGWDRAVPALLGGWIVAVGTGRTVAMQRDWDRVNYHPAQNHMLVQLTDMAPELRPQTLVLLIDETRSWPVSMSFRYAVEYLYEGRATGHVWKASQFLYRVSFGKEGVSSEPWPIIRESWRSPPSLHRYSEIVVVRYTPDRKFSLLTDWPDLLPPLPPGAFYEPEARIVTGGTLPAARRILRRSD